jgi:hypothetical protein
MPNWCLVIFPLRKLRNRRDDSAGLIETYFLIFSIQFYSITTNFLETPVFVEGIFTTIISFLMSKSLMDILASSSLLHAPATPKIKAT